MRSAGAVARGPGRVRPTVLLELVGTGISMLPGGCGGVGGSVQV